jgi:adenylate cyclase
LLAGPWVRGALLGLAAFVLTVLAGQTPLGPRLEYAALDRLTTWRPPRPLPPEILIVGIDEASFQELRRPWPWPRSLHARLIERLAASGARLIVFDVVFADPTAPGEDEALAAAIRRAGNVILAQDLDTVHDPGFFRQILVQPCGPLRTAALRLGLAQLTPDADGVVRRFSLNLAGQETLAAAAWRAYGPGGGAGPPEAALLDFVGPPRSLDTASYYQVIDPDRPLPESRIRGRVVFIGRTLGASPSPQARADVFYTPYYAATGRMMAGVEVHGHILNTLLKQTWGREAPAPARLSLALALLLAAAQLLARLKPLPGLAALMALIGVSLGLAALVFLVWRWWFPPVLLSGGLALVYGASVLSHYLIAAKEKRWLRQAFGRYLSPAVVQAIVAHPERLELGGEEVEGTVLFADLAGFTGLSEHMAPQALIRLLNEYFSPLTDIILAQGGTLDKYIGDAIMAFWGAPLPASDHGVRACRAALDMQAAMARLTADWQARGLPRLHTRMGLHSGPLVVGNVGSRERFDYTVLGDTVNLASRLEGVNKVYGSSIIVSENTHRLAAGAFLMRQLDVVQVKGRAQPVAIYEPLGEAAAAAPAWLEAFQAGLQAYMARQWGLAAANFQQVLALKPYDPPAQVDLARLNHFRQQPPPPDWPGVFVLDSK